MSEYFKFLSILFLIISCQQEKGLLIPTSNTIKVTKNDTKDSIILKSAHVVPTKNQYEALKNEFIAFIHFGPNTFTGMEWGNGMEDPKIFNLKTLDTDQWCKSIKSAGMKMIIITVKHHDGFVLWQSRYTKHGVMSTSFQEGKGDVLRELSKSCEKYGLKLGIYLSPADLYQIENKNGLYGNLSKYSDRVIPKPVKGRPFKNKTKFTFKVDDYNEYFLNQLFELLTEYGPIHEVWFDGAHPKRKGGQKYNYLAWKQLIKTLAPQVVVFGKQDVRWCGNESGATRETEWNVIPYKENPKLMNRFGDLIKKDLGSREKLYKSKYLHYQQAETNTSIREGWFYRDDNSQKVRNADDVFDIYERSVGGNSTFLLNIPPNRNGKFPQEDVKVLNEVGKRIKATYGINLFDGANGSKNVLDKDISSFKLLETNTGEVIISTSKPVTINRLVIQESIATHGERIEKHALDVWVNNEWKEVSKATNVGYKRILRFPEVTSSKFRVRILNSRLNPAISNITAHYYKTRPPQLAINRSLEGLVTISSKRHKFNWKPHGENSSLNINLGIEMHYTTDGSIPTKNSKLYKRPFKISSGKVKAIAFSKNEKGSLVSSTFGILKENWKVLKTDSWMSKHQAKLAIDENPKTYWISKKKDDSHYIEIDLGKKYSLKSFGYTPQTSLSVGMIEKGIIMTSDNGKFWKKHEKFEFGNLINNPTQRIYFFKEKVISRYIRIESRSIAGSSKQVAIAELDFYE